MILPIPRGTRDVLPDEMGELRTLTERVRAVFTDAGYGEIYTPALEYETVIERGSLGGARPAYRVFDETGEVLVLRSDMTVPIARVVGTRYANAQLPLRFAYFAHCYRASRPQGSRTICPSATARAWRCSRCRATPTARIRWRIPGW